MLTRRTRSAWARRAADGALHLVCATDRPALRHTTSGRPFFEQLDHRGDAHLARIRSRHGIPLLIDHDADQRVGRVRVGAVVDDNGHRATLAAGRIRAERAAELLANLESGDLSAVSIGYAIRAHRVSGEHRGHPIVLVSDWVIEEVSILDKLPPIDAEARVLPPNV